MFTADEARKLCEAGVNEAVETACEKIRDAASKKERSIILRDEPWGLGAYYKDDFWKQCTTKLESLGFITSIFCDGILSGDVGTKVEW